MTNLDAIKKDLCRQIMAATPEQIQLIAYSVEEGYINLNWINMNKTLTCEECKIKYGGCKTEESNQDCIDNFIKFCSEEI